MPLADDRAVPETGSILILLAAGAGFCAALLAANLITSEQNRLRRRNELLAEVGRRRAAYEKRVQAEIDAFEAEFGDVDIFFDS